MIFPSRGAGFTFSATALASASATTREGRDEGVRFHKPHQPLISRPMNPEPHQDTLA